MASQVGRTRDMHGNSEMNTIGYAMALVLLVLVLPLLPFFLFVYLLARLAGTTSQPDEDRVAE